jgi:catechol 2,3-dioxygenase-like lactoylglutathione lyase family enzyme
MIRHVAGVAEIVDDMAKAIAFYLDLGLTVEHDAGSPYATVHVPGVLHFGLWLRTAAAEAVYGDAAAAERVPLGFTIGFEVDDVARAGQRLAEKGRQLVHPPREEPWGQKTSRFVSVSGALCEFSETPWARTL